MYVYTHYIYIYIYRERERDREREREMLFRTEAREQLLGARCDLAQFLQVLPRQPLTSGARRSGGTSGGAGAVADSGAK